MTSPLRSGILGRRYNRTLHGRSVHRPANVYHHNIIHGFRRLLRLRLEHPEDNGDALDVFEKIGQKKGSIAGEPVFAMHDGTITAIVEPTGRLGCVYIENRKLELLTVNAHLHVLESLKVGQKVKEGQKIGHVGRILSDAHLHLEVYIRGQALAAAKPERLAELISQGKWLV